MLTSTVDRVQLYYVVLDFIVVTTTVDIMQWYCAVCVDYCDYRNSRYSAMLLSCVWRLFW